MPYFGTPQMCNVVGEDEHHTCDECRFSSAPEDDTTLATKRCRFSTVSEDNTTLATVPIQQ